ncbi:MAG: YceI family protein [Bacteroidota bacterium]
MKSIVTCMLIILLTATTLVLQAQIYTAPQGKIHFHSSTPLEDIDAVSSEANCVLDATGRKITAKVEMKSFAFPKPLMQQHFNESYVESDKFPYAILEATIVEKISFTKSGTYNITLKGTFEVHGIKRERTIKSKLIVHNGQPEKATAEFDVKLADHDIKVPTILVMKVAEIIKVDVSFTFNKVAKP